MSEPLARATFAATCDERTDVALRSADRFASARAAARLGSAIAVAMVCVVAVVSAVVLLRWMLHQSWLLTGFTAVAAAGCGMWGLPARLRRARMKAVRKVVAEATGEEPSPVDVALYADRIDVDLGWHSISLPWRDVRPARLVDGDVEIAGSLELLVVRARAFAGPEQAQAFAALATRLADEARRSAPPVLLPKS